MREQVATGLQYVLAILLGMLVGTFLHAEVHEDNEAKTETSTDTLRVETTKKVDHNSAQWMARALYSEKKRISDYEYNGWVIRNRVEDEDYPGSVRQVVLQEKQFSAFNDYSKRKHLESLSYPETKDTEFRRAYRMAKYVLSAPESSNPMPMVTHFYHKRTMEQKYGKSAPDWAHHGELVYAHGQARYYKNVRPPSLSPTTASR